MGQLMADEISSADEQNYWVDFYAGLDLSEYGDYTVQVFWIDWATASNLSIGEQ